MQAAWPVNMGCPASCNSLDLGKACCAKKLCVSLWPNTFQLQCVSTHAAAACINHTATTLCKAALNCKDTQCHICMVLLLPVVHCFCSWCFWSCQSNVHMPHVHKQNQHVITYAQNNLLQELTCQPAQVHPAISFKLTCCTSPVYQFACSSIQPHTGNGTWTREHSGTTAATQFVPCDYVHHGPTQLCQQPAATTWGTSGIKQYIPHLCMHLHLQV